MRLRDYPLPVLSVTEGHLRGTVVLAEPAALEDGKRVVGVPVGGGETRDVVLGASPFKVYHDLDLCAADWQVAYGPCLEPALSQFGLAIDMVLPVSTDPSPPLAWFDKMRYLRHGLLRLRLQRFGAALLKSNDPHAAKEVLQVAMSDVQGDWTPSQMTLAASQVRYTIGTRGKFDGCPLLEIPRLDVTVKLSWQCLGDPLAHHTPMPVAPEVARPGHDTYAAFRSTSLRLAVELDCPAVRTSRPTSGHTKPDSPAPTTAGACPAGDTGGGEAPEAPEADGGCVAGGEAREGVSVLLYAHTLGWLRGLSDQLASVSRPIRRGTLYNERLPPRKPSLGQHLAGVTLKAGVERPAAVYFNSYERTEGISLAASSGSLDAVYAHEREREEEPAGADGGGGAAPALQRAAQYVWYPSSASGCLRDMQGHALHVGGASPGTLGATLRGEHLVKDLPGLIAALASGSWDAVERHSLLLCPLVEYVVHQAPQNSTRHMSAASRFSRSASADVADGRSPSVSARASPSVRGVSPAAAGRRASQLSPGAERLISESAGAMAEEDCRHHVVVDKLRFAWHDATRKVLRHVYRTYLQAKELAADLSGEALVPTAGNGQPSSVPESPLLAQDKSFSMLDELVADATAGGAAIWAMDETGDRGAGSFNHLTEVSLADVVSKELRVEFKEPQMYFRAPDAPEMAIIMAAGGATVQQRNHQMVYRRGRLDCKTSWQGSVADVRYFAAPASSPLEVAKAALDGAAPAGGADEAVWASAKALADTLTEE